MLARGAVSWDSPLKTSFEVERPKPLVPVYTDEDGGDTEGVSRKGSEDSSTQV